MVVHVSGVGPLVGQVLIVEQRNRAPALREDGTPTVLKLSFPGDKEFATEATALAVFDGRGICGLLEFDPTRGAMLLERLQPGAPLTTIEDDEEAPPPVHRFLSTGDAEPFARLGRRFLGPEVGTVGRLEERLCS